MNGSRCESSTKQGRFRTDQQGVRATIPRSQAEAHPLYDQGGWGSSQDGIKKAIKALEERLELGFDTSRPIYLEHGEILLALPLPARSRF